jgi:hypothetical protein
MPSLDQMSKPELLAELSRCADAFGRLSRAVGCAARRQQFSKDVHSAIRAPQDEQAHVADMNRLMDRSWHGADLSLTSALLG